MGIIIIIIVIVIINMNKKLLVWTLKTNFYVRRCHLVQVLLLFFSLYGEGEDYCKFLQLENGRYHRQEKISVEMSSSLRWQLLYYTFHVKRGM